MNIFEAQFSEDRIESGAWFRPSYPTGPKEGDPMVGENGEPVRLRVRSVDSAPYREYLTQRSRKNVGTMVAGKGRKGQKELVNNTTRDDRAEQFAVLVSGLENVDKPGKITTPEQDDLLKFVADHDKDRGWILRSGMVWLVDAVIEFANEPTNYGASVGEGKDVTEPAGDPPTS
jgi:hypothetical protein